MCLQGLAPSPSRKNLMESKVTSLISLFDTSDMQLLIARDELTTQEAVEEEVVKW